MFTQTDITIALWLFIVIVVSGILFSAILGFYYGFFLAATRPDYFDDDRHHRH